MCISNEGLFIGPRFLDFIVKRSFLIALYYKTTSFQACVQLNLNRIATARLPLLHILKV